MQIKVWLLGISPMAWRRVLVLSTCTLRELHGVIQVAMGWEGIHLYQFCLRAARYGSWDAQLVRLGRGGRVECVEILAHRTCLGFAIGGPCLGQAVPGQAPPPPVQTG